MWVIVRAEIVGGNEGHDGACTRRLWRELDSAPGKRPSAEAHHVDAIGEVEVAGRFLDHEGRVAKRRLRRLRGSAQVRAPAWRPCRRSRHSDWQDYSGWRLGRQSKLWQRCQIGRAHV